jgi:hypothetical protein
MTEPAPHALRRRDAAAWLLAAGAGAGYATGLRPMAVRMPGPPYPQPEPTFQSQLLGLALEKAGFALQLQPMASQSWMRQIRELHGGFVDVAPLPAASEAYGAFDLRRIHLPLRPGLLGLRLFICRADRVPELAQWRDLPQFQQALRLGYGSDWADRPLMQRLGFKLVTARTTEALYDLLQSGQCDVLSRGLNEVETELAYFGRPTPHQQSRFVVLPGVALHYPLDDCFFASPQRADLHQALTLGLQVAVADGSWVRLLATWYGPTLQRLGMAQRRLWSLSGYPAPDGLPAHLLNLQRWLSVMMGTPSR